MVDINSKKSPGYPCSAASCVSMRRSLFLFCHGWSIESFLLESESCMLRKNKDIPLRPSEKENCANNDAVLVFQGCEQPSLLSHVFQSGKCVRHHHSISNRRKNESKSRDLCVGIPMGFAMGGKQCCKPLFASPVLVCFTG